MTIDVVLDHLNEPITRRSLVFKDDEIEVKEEDPITPDPLKEEDISLINTADLWNHPSILYWNHNVIYLLSRIINRSVQKKVNHVFLY